MTENSTVEDRKKEAFFTHEHDPHAGHLYYFGPVARTAPPYKTQRIVRAIVDIAADGTLAGVELIDDMPPPPKKGL